MGRSRVTAAVHPGGDRSAGIARDDVEDGVAVACRRHLRIDLPLPGFLRLRPRKLALERLAGLIGAVRLDPAERGHRLLDQQAVDAEHDAEKRNEPEQHHAAGDFSFPDSAG